MNHTGSTLTTSVLYLARERRTTTLNGSETELRASYINGNSFNTEFAQIVLRVMNRLNNQMHTAGSLSSVTLNVISAGLKTDLGIMEHLFSYTRIQCLPFYNTEHRDGASKLP